MTTPPATPPRAVTDRPRPVVRCKRDAALAALGAVVLALTVLPVDENSVDALEADVFVVLNSTTVLPFAVVWPFMQLGNFVVVPVAAAVAAVCRRWRLAFGMLVGGVAVYVLAKVVKGEVVRGRPAVLLDDVVIRGAESLGRGYPSGHAAVATLLAVLAWPWLGRRGRVLVAAGATAVCLSRVYVGAHLPLDVVGGAALGLTLAGLLRLVLGRPGPCS
jgi:membrane-associated phospholipid phosphatase